jgi:hypothetical protein
MNQIKDKKTKPNIIIQETIRFMREKQDGPFFLYLAHKYVHVPSYLQRRFMQQSRNGLYRGVVGCLDWSVDVVTPKQVYSICLLFTSTVSEILSSIDTWRFGHDDFANYPGCNSRAGTVVYNFAARTVQVGFRQLSA